MRVVYAALEMLAANRYVGRVPGGKSYRVTWTRAAFTRGRADEHAGQGARRNRS